MLSADRSKEISRHMADLVDRALEDKGVSARSVSIDVVGHDGLIRDIRAGRIPSYDRVRALFEYLDIDLYMNPATSAPEEIDYLATTPNLTLPLHGMAKCGIQGWADDRLEREPIPRPAWVSDDSAFWVIASGQSMVPEGISSGDFCLVSPGRMPRIGDRIWIKQASVEKRVSIKRLIDLTSEKATLRGWLPVRDGSQDDFIEERPLKAVAELFPVIGVYRGLFGKSGVHVQFLPDPQTGPGTRNDGLVVVELLVDSIAKSNLHRFPSAMSFPAKWLQQRGLRSGSVALAAVSDAYLAPAIPEGSVVLINTSIRQTGENGLYAVQVNGAIRIRRIEQLPNGTLLLGGDNQIAQTSLIPKERRGSVSILGKVVWVGSNL